MFGNPLFFEAVKYIALAGAEMDYPMPSLVCTLFTSPTDNHENLRSIEEIFCIELLFEHLLEAKARGLYWDLVLTINRVMSECKRFDASARACLMDDGGKLLVDVASVPKPSWAF